MINTDMNVYDWDETIFETDSTLGFVFYLYRKRPLTLISIPRTGICGLLYVLRLMPKLKFKENLYHMFVYVKDMEKAVDAYTDQYLYKVQEWYRKQQKEDDVVISASPEFLISSFCQKVGIRTCMASQVDIHTGKYNGLNCHGEEKVRRFRMMFPEGTISEFYSDSLSDSPLARIAEKAFLIRKGVKKPWPVQE